MLAAYSIFCSQIFSKQFRFNRSKIEYNLWFCPNHCLRHLPISVNVNSILKFLKWKRLSHRIYSIHFKKPVHSTLRLIQNQIPFHHLSTTIWIRALSISPIVMQLLPNSSLGSTFVLLGSLFPKAKSDLFKSKISCHSSTENCPVGFHLT